MENVGDGPLAERPAARKTARLALAVGGVVFIVLLGWGLWYHTAGAKRWSQALGYELLSPLVVALTAFCVAMPLGTLAALAEGRRGRWSTVLRLRIFRVIPAFFLALVTPIKLLGPFPIAMVYLESAVPQASSLMLAFIYAGRIPVIVGFWYLVTGLVVSGVCSWVLRVAIFGQVWIGIYAGHLLFLGYGG